ncbi:LOW QUALITY PROTEIN: serine/threonine-protein kinase pim-1-like [Sylvia atricapilla]|uniref:LOW QUALITY PROTEIN: serine/threonine-protein kinase pim-1-like n=1 Tax=Sylvia atricapilla TaxID=48155 RepID=UPI003397DBDB
MEIVDYSALNEVTPPLSAAVPDMLELQLRSCPRGARGSSVERTRGQTAPGLQLQRRQRRQQQRLYKVYGVYELPLSLVPPLPLSLFGPGRAPDPGPGRPAAVSPPPGSGCAGFRAAGRGSVPGAGAASPPFGCARAGPGPGPSRAPRRTHTARPLPPPPLRLPRPELRRSAARPPAPSRRGPGRVGMPGPALGGRSGAVSGPGPSAEGRVSPTGKAREALQDRYRLGSLLGRGGFGTVCSGTRLSDGAPVAIKCVPRDRIRHWGELTNGAHAPLEIVLLDKVSGGCARVIQLLEWVELPSSFLLVLEHPERCQDLSAFLAERRFLPEEEARGLFRQVLEAVRHCTSCGVLHRDIKPGNILFDLATGQLKLIDFGCGAFLRDTAYTQFAGTLSYSPPEWIHHQCYHGEAATIWSLGLLLYHLVMGKHPFRRGQQIIWGQILFPRWLSQECQDVIKRCLSMQPLDRPSLEDLFNDPWLQGVHLP